MPQVKRLDGLLSSGVPLVAMSFGDTGIEEEVRQAHTRGLDVAELRIDTFRYTNVEYVIDHVRAFASLPTIATIRLSLFKAVIPEVHGVDIELSSGAILGEVVASAKAAKRVVIVSNHNFAETPSTTELVDMAQRAKDAGADYVKLSAMASSQEAIQRLAKFTIDYADLGLIVIGMGGHGSATRVFLPLLGSRLTYARSNLHTVSGQLSFDETFELLRQFSPEFNDKKINDLEILDEA